MTVKNRIRKTAKVAISMPEDTLNAVEERRKSSGESRSEFFRRAAERLLQQERESAAVSAYRQGYREMPESSEEVEAVHRAASAILTEEPWE